MKSGPKIAEWLRMQRERADRARAAIEAEVPDGSPCEAVVARTRIRQTVAVLDDVIAFVDG